MGAFDYLSVLISIVLGLGITQLLGGFGRWLEQRKALKAYAPAIVWAIALLLVHVQTWWSMFGLRYWEEWTFLQFSVVLAQPIILYLMAALVFPTSTSDMRANFYLQRPWFFGLFLTLLGVSVARDLLRQGALPEPANLVFHIVLFLIGILGLITTRHLHHRILAYLVLLMMVAYITLLFSMLA